MLDVINARGNDLVDTNFSCIRGDFKAPPPYVTVPLQHIHSNSVINLNVKKKINMTDR